MFFFFFLVSTAELYRETPFKSEQQVVIEQSLFPSIKIQLLLNDKLEKNKNFQYSNYYYLKFEWMAP